MTRKEEYYLKQWIEYNNAQNRGESPEQVYQRSVSDMQKTMRGEYGPPPGYTEYTEPLPVIGKSKAPIIIGAAVLAVIVVVVVIIKLKKKK